MTAELSTTNMAAALLRDLGRAPRDWALFLDIDGTLIDIAPTPEAVEIPHMLPPALARLNAALGGALALITGRRCDWAAHHFGPFAISGLHGAERLDATGHYATLGPPRSAVERARALIAAKLPQDVLLEDKGGTLAVHYRQAPAQARTVAALMADTARLLGPEWVVQHGKMVLELRPADTDKGQAVDFWLTTPAFAGRSVLAIGDDTTDEAMFAAARKHGGHAIRIAADGYATHADAILPSPAALRQLLQEIA
ncbi:MAG: trehalose-phosphatase [Paracoccaceae bacterium]